MTKTLVIKLAFTLFAFPVANGTAHADIIPNSLHGDYIVIDVRKNSTVASTAQLGIGNNNSPNQSTLAKPLRVKFRRNKSNNLKR